MDNSNDINFIKNNQNDLFQNDRATNCNQILGPSHLSNKALKPLRFKNPKLKKNIIKNNKKIQKYIGSKLRVQLKSVKNKKQIKKEYSTTEEDESEDEQIEDISLNSIELTNVQKELLSYYNSIWRENKLEIAEGIGEPCSCAKQCFNRIVNDEKHEIFKKFWNLKNSNEQSEYIRNSIRFIENKQKRANIKKRKRNNYLFVVTSNTNSYKICKVAFLNLLGLNKYYLERIIQKILMVYQPKENQYELINEINKVKQYIRNSNEFKNCNENPNQISNCYKRYLFLSKNNKFPFSENKFKQMFNDELKTKLRKMCRVCLAVFDNECELIDIFCDNENICDKLLELASVQISKNEKNIPQVICKNCLDRLNSSLTFQRLCIESDKILRGDSNEDFQEDNANFLVTNIKNEFDEIDHLDMEQPDLLDLKKSLVNFSKEIDKIEQQKLKLRYTLENKEGAFRIKKHHEYDFLRTKLVNIDGKIQGPPCDCPRKCYTLLSKEERQKIFNRFWRIKVQSKQNSYIHDCLESADVKRRRPRKNDDTSANNRRIFTIYYRVPIENGKKWAKVCRKAFLNLHCIKVKRVNTVIQNKRIEFSKQIQGTDMLKEEFYTTDEEEDEDVQPNLLPMYTCQICLSKYSNLCSFRRHKRYKNHYTLDEITKKNQIKKWQPNKNGEFVCNECNTVFKTKSSIKNHFYNFHRIKKYTCEMCGQIFTKYRMFKSHKVQHKRQENDEGDLKERVAKANNSIEPSVSQMQLFNCDICLKDGFIYGSLEKHKMEHLVDRQQESQLNFPCHLCGNVFMYPNLLNDHIVTKHYY